MQDNDRTFTDQTGRAVSIKFPPENIVSLVPSQTELLYSLGLENEVQGITKFCIHPESWFRSKRRVGGTKNLNMESIRQINPDLIIANKEENEKEQIEELAKEFPVWISDITDLPGAIKMIEDVGEITGKSEIAREITAAVKAGFKELKPLQTELSAVYLIWKDPIMAVAGDTFISEMMARCGLNNLLKNDTRYPELTLEELKKLSPDVLILSSEPYPFTEKHQKEFEAVLPGVRVVLADGEMFSWYGSRLIKSPGYFSQFLSQLVH